MSGLVVAVDCSTTASKAIVVDADGQVLASGRSAIQTTTPAPGFHEQDAREWLSATLAAVRDAVIALPAAARARVRALAVTHQRESFVLLDAAGEPVRPAILWVDSRAHAQIADLGSRTFAGRSVHDVSGKPPDTTPALYKLAWLDEHEPAALRGARLVVDVQAFLALHLTGRAATSRPSADTLGLFDLERGGWDPDLVAAAGLRDEQLPELVDAGEVIGTLLPDVVVAVGLPAGQEVAQVAGIGDGQSAGLALGVEEPGVAYLNLGTSMVCGISSPRYLTSPAFRTLGGVTPRTFVLETVLNAAAYLASWTAELAGSDVTTMEVAAAQVEPGCEGLLVLPYWNAAQTPHWDPLARGAVVGWHGRHTTAHLYRGVLEGVAFELRLQLGLIEEATGATIDALRAVGGGARSTLWTQIVADVTGKHVAIHSDGELSALGAAVDGHRAVTPGFVRWPARASRVVTPDAARSETYRRLFPAYTTLYPALRGTFAALAAPTQIS